MQKIIKEVDAKTKTVQITTLDERWYTKPSTHEDTGLPSFVYVPSVTWITGYYPKGIGYMQWLAKKGWDEAEAIKAEAGDKGTIVHHAIGLLLHTGSLKIDEKIA